MHARDQCGKKMSVFTILVAASLIACTVALVRALNWFGCPTNAQANVLTKKHKSKCERRKVGAYKVAIVGAGAGGCSAAYFINDLMGQTAKVDVYSNDKVGGRIAVVEYGGRQYEAGASILHKDNQYMAGFASMFGLKKVMAPVGTGFGIFNGQHFVFRSSAISLLTKIRLLFRYGFSLFSVNRHVDDMLRRFSRIYSLQQHKGQTFYTVPDMLKAMGGSSFYHMTQVTAREYLQSELHWNKRLVDELVTCAMTTNYGQTCDVNAFVCMVSLAGVQDNSLFSILGGNYQIPERCLNASNATLCRAQVTVIEKQTNQSGRVTYSLTYLPLSDGGEVAGAVTAEVYDAIILAAPLFNCGIQFKSFSKDIYTEQAKQPYHQTVATFVEGKLNPEAFGEKHLFRTFPLSIMTMEQQNPKISINSDAVQIPVDVKEKDVKDFLRPLTEDPSRVWKIFSNDPLTDEDLSKIYVSSDAPQFRVWRAYPNYHPPESFSPFVLDDSKLFYVNCIEYAASAMEMSAIAAKNCALLVDEVLAKEYYDD